MQVSAAAHVHTHSSGKEQRHGCGEWGKQRRAGPTAHAVPAAVCPAAAGNLDW